MSYRMTHTCLSSAHKVPPSTEVTVAALGALYINANSPNDPLLSYEATLTSSPSIFWKLHHHENVEKFQSKNVRSKMSVIYLVYVINTIFNNVEVISVITLCNNFLTRFGWEFEHSIQYGVELFAFQTEKILWFMLHKLCILGIVDIPIK